MDGRNTLLLHPCSAVASFCMGGRHATAKGDHSKGQKQWPVSPSRGGTVAAVETEEPPMVSFVKGVGSMDTDDAAVERFPSQQHC